MLNLDNRANIKGLENYLRMDGLAFKVTPYGGPRDFISPQKLHKNLFEEFRYRNLNNLEVYYNDNILGLLQNYRSAFLRLANYYQTQGKGDPSMNEKALAVLDKMNEAMPEEVIPLRNYQLSLQFGRMYAEAGRPQELEKRLRRAPQVYKMDAVDMLFLAEYYSQFLRNDARAESLALEVLKQSPQSSQPYGWLMSHYARTRQYGKSVDILQRWLNEHPTDKDAKARLEELQVLAHLQDSLKISNKSGDGGVSPPEKKTVNRIR
jgi:hypothetical protein